MSSNVLHRNVQSSGPSYKAATKRLVEPFWDLVEQVFSQVDGLIGNRAMYAEDDIRPTKDNVDWAKEVLLRCGLPRYFLVGAEIDVFHGEIHVSWESASKRVVAFLPRAQELKIYYETIENGTVTSHELRPNQGAADLQERLHWFFA